MLALRRRRAKPRVSAGLIWWRTKLVRSTLWKGLRGRMRQISAIIGRDRNTAITHRINEAWSKFWSLRTALCSRTVGRKVKLQRLRTEVVLVLL